MASYPLALTIAGSDSGGCAGIQADLKAFSSLGVFGASVITAITAQNTMGVIDVMAVPGSMVEKQLKAVLDDFDFGAIKNPTSSDTKISFDMISFNLLKASLEEVFIFFNPCFTIV